MPLVLARRAIRSAARKARAWIVMVGWPSPEVTKLLPSTLGAVANHRSMNRTTRASRAPGGFVGGDDLGADGVELAGLLGGEKLERLLGRHRRDVVGDRPERLGGKRGPRPRP